MEETGAFDYNRLVSDLSSEQLLIGGERDVIEAAVADGQQTIEPMKTHVPATKEDERSQWKVIVQFMRENPRFLLEMVEQSKPLKGESKEKQEEVRGHVIDVFSSEYLEGLII